MNNMKKILKKSAIILALALSFTSSANDDVNGKKNGDVIIFSGKPSPRLAEVQPQGWFNRDTRMLTIEFPAAGFVSYTLSVSSDDATLNYIVTSPLYRVYVPTYIVEVDLQLETDSGDIFYGSFDATGGTMI